MKKLLLIVSTNLLIVSIAAAQVKSGDADLDRRLAEYMKYTEEMDFEKVVDYLHPKFFDIIPRELMIASLKESFENDEPKMGMKDFEVTAIEGAFVSEGSEYRKIVSTMTITMKYSDTSTLRDPEYALMMKEMLLATMKGKEVTIDTVSNTIYIKGDEIIFAVRDKGKEWMFIGYKDEPELIKLLFPRPVIDYYKL